MASTVVMPRAGISVESCIMGQWRKSPGDKVRVGEVLFDYETDKASFECESTVEGTLLECFFQEGDEVPCLLAVCAIGEAGEDIAALRPDGAAVGGDVRREEPQIGASPAAPMEENVQEAAAQESAAQAERAVVTPVAKRISPRAETLAKRLGLDPAMARPTGPNERVIARDIETLAATLRSGTGFGGRSFEEAGPAAESLAQQAVAPPAEPAAQQAADPEAEAIPRQTAAPAAQLDSAQEEAVASAPMAAYTDVKFTNIRKAIAAGMEKSLRETAQLTHHNSFDASAILAFRKTLKTAGEATGTQGITLNDMILFALSRVLPLHPDLNAHLLNGDTLRRFSGVHLGMAVDTPRGLMVPTIFHAERLSLKTISLRAKELAALCQTGKISPDLLTGASFTVSNLGTLGVEQFTPIINPPQVAILGVSGTLMRLRESEDGSMEPYPAMGLSLTYDHRAIDGAPAARFARDLCDNLAKFSLLLAL